jgi:hypothetical protein
MTYILPSPLLAACDQPNNLVRGGQTLRCKMATDRTSSAGEGRGRFVAAKNSFSRPAGPASLFRVPEIGSVPSGRTARTHTCITTFACVDNISPGR